MSYRYPVVDNLEEEGFEGTDPFLRAIVDKYPEVYSGAR